MIADKTLIGLVIDDRFEILSASGEGGMGSIYKARNLELDRVVAIKLLHATLLKDRENRARFDREGKILAELSHQHITTFHHIGVWKNQHPYIVMEYLEGSTLRDSINSINRLPLERALNVTVQICDAMNFAHSRGVIHRDLKPNNIMLLEQPKVDFVKMLDFGLARLQSPPAGAKLTRTGALIGSMYYMSPEQCQGENADNRSDIYALGCVLFESVSGEPPVVADNPIAIMHKHVHDTPPSLSAKLGKQIPREFDDILLKAMAKDPADRYQTMDEFRHDLQLLQWGKTRDIKASQKRSQRSFFGIKLPRRY